MRLSNAFPQIDEEEQDRGKDLARIDCDSP